MVVLSWDDVRAGAADIHDGHNVVLHEFAHQLDQEDGAADGAPILDRRSQYVAWAGCSGAEYEQLRRDSRAGPQERARRVRGDQPRRVLRRGDRVLLREARPLRKKHPELYEELKEYYRQDPAELVAS